MLNVRQFYFINFLSLFNCIYFSDDLHNIFIIFWIFQLAYFMYRPINRYTKTDTPWAPPSRWPIPRLWTMGTSLASEHNAISYPNFHLHHSLQHHSGSTANLFCPTREFYEHPTHKKLPYPSNFPLSHPLHYTHLFSLSLRRFLWNLPFTANRLWPIRCDVLHGVSCHYGGQEKECGGEWEKKLCPSFGSLPSS